MDSTSLQKMLSEIVSYDDFLKVRRNIFESDRDNLFQRLWALSIQRPDGSSTGMAAYMLVELQPTSKQSLESLLSDIHASGLDASNRAVPFYLVAEYGKHTVLEACSKFIEGLAAESPRSRVDAVQYWASFPASELCKHFHDWEARDMYGVVDDA